MSCIFIHIFQFHTHTTKICNLTLRCILKSYLYNQLETTNSTPFFTVLFFNTCFQIFCLQGERLSHAVGCAFAVCLERKQKRDKECSVTMNFDPSTSTFTRSGSFRQQSYTDKLQDTTNVNNNVNTLITTTANSTSNITIPATTVININNNINTNYNRKGIIFPLLLIVRTHDNISINVLIWYLDKRSSFSLR